MSDNVTVTINGMEVTVPKGTNVVEAAKLANVDIPHFCYHSHLPVDGNCRMCQVEIEGMRGTPIACNTTCDRDGMEIRTETEAVQEIRAAVMEFLLVNHPIDCPVCDQAGECKLQDYYMEHDRRDSAIPLDDKVRKSKALEVGPKVMLDQERCVSCSRCVRFCDHVSKTGELRIFNRGDRATIGTYPGKPLDNAYSVNTADICPVGALTSRDFRFQARAWWLSKSDTICPGCSTGCNVELHHYRHNMLDDHNGTAYRIRPRVNDEVNDAWMCDAGREEYVGINEGRVAQPVAYSVEVGWEGAVGNVVSMFQKIGDHAGRVAGITSFDCTNEEIWLFRHFMQEVFGQGRIAVIPNRVSGDADDYLISEDKHPNRLGATLVAGDAAAADIPAYLEGMAAVVTFGANPLGFGVSEEVRTAFGAIKHRIALASNEDETTDSAGIVLPTPTFAEKSGTWVNRNQRVQRIQPALPARFQSRDGLEVMALLARGIGVDWAHSTSAESLFDELAGSVEAFGGLEYAEIGDKGMMLRTVPSAGGA